MTVLERVGRLHRREGVVTGIARRGQDLEVPEAERPPDDAALRHDVGDRRQQ
jgi:hypothetical protein